MDRNRSIFLCRKKVFVFLQRIMFIPVYCRFTGVSMIISSYLSYQSFTSFLLLAIIFTSGYDNSLGFVFVLFLTYYSDECQRQCFNSCKAMFLIFLPTHKNSTDFNIDNTCFSRRLSSLLAISISLCNESFLYQLLYAVDKK